MIDINAGDLLFCLSEADNFVKRASYKVKISTDKLYYVNDIYGDVCYISMDDSGISVCNASAFFTTKKEVANNA